MAIPRCITFRMAPVYLIGLELSGMVGQALALRATPYDLLGFPSPDFRAVGCLGEAIPVGNVCQTHAVWGVGALDVAAASNCSRKAFESTTEKGDLFGAKERVGTRLNENKAVRIEGEHDARVWRLLRVPSPQK